MSEGVVWVSGDSRQGTKHVCDLGEYIYAEIWYLTHIVLAAFFKFKIIKLLEHILIKVSEKIMDFQPQG